MATNETTRCCLTPAELRELPLPAALELLGLHRRGDGSLEHAPHLVGVTAEGSTRLPGELLPAGSGDDEVVAFLHADGYVECDETCCAEGCQ